MVEILKLMLNWDSELSELKFWRFKELVIWTQPSGPLCLWQCFVCQLDIRQVKLPLLLLANFQHSDQLTSFQRIKNISAILWFDVLKHISCKFNFRIHFSHSVLEILSILISSLCTIFCWVCFHQIKVANHKYEDSKKLFPSSFSFTWDLMLATLVGPLVNQLCKWHE